MAVARSPNGDTSIDLEVSIWKVRSFGGQLRAERHLPQQNRQAGVLRKSDRAGNGDTVTIIISFATGVAVGVLTALLVKLHMERLPQSADWHKQCLVDIYRYQPRGRAGQGL
jgi:hypothetical protein